MRRISTVLMLSLIQFFHISCSGNNGGPSVGGDQDASTVPDSGTMGQDLGRDDTGGGDDPDMVAINDVSGDLDPSSEMGTDTPPSVPLIGDAELCDIPAQPRLSVVPGDELKKVTLDEYPDALCNDGSPALLYVRPAPQGSPDADKWVVWLEGGGGCLDEVDCAERWCGSQSPVYSAAKMSSRFAPDAIEATGIFDHAPGNGTLTNRFAGFNQVIAYFCSSDNWVGTSTIVASPEGYPEYRIHFRGSRIVDALAAELRAGSVSDDGMVTMPSVDDASTLLFTGTSAGGGGVRYNSNRMRDMLLAGNADLDFRMVVDAGFHNLEADPPHISEQEAADNAVRYYDVMQNWRGAVLDPRCLAYHADSPEICADAVHTTIHHVAFPYFVKMDISDASNTPGNYPDDMAFTQSTHRLLLSLSDVTTFSEENSTVTPGVFGPSCGHHVNLEVPAFYRIGLSNDGGTTAVSMHDVLWNWLNGDTPVRVVHDPPNGITSVCP